MDGRWLISIFLVSQTLAAQPADEAVSVTVCDQTHPQRTTKLLSESCDVKDSKCSVYSPIRSNLCEARRLRGEADVNFELFGRNDCRASENIRTLASITHVVIHNGGWNALHNSNTWACRPAASHYSIQRDGIIYQHIGEELIAPHARDLNEFSIGIELNLPKEAGQSCNSLKFKAGATLSEKEAIVRTACTPNAAQYESLGKLIKAISLRTSVTLDEEHIVGHCESSAGKNAHGDPRAFDWSEIGLSNDIKQARAIGTSCSWYHLF